MGELPCTAVTVENEISKQLAYSEYMLLSYFQKTILKTVNIHLHTNSINSPLADNILS